MERKQLLLAAVLIIALIASVSVAFLQSFAWKDTRVINTGSASLPSE